LALKTVSRQAVPDMPDRIMAATALHKGLPLITRDSNLRSCGIETIW
jgi:predicted nucleic acid-binding protein